MGQSSIAVSRGVDKIQPGGNMRNLPIPVDTTRLTFVCVSAPRPRLLDQNTGEVKTDKQGRTVYAVGVSAADENGRAELLSVNVSGEPQVAVGQIVELVD